SDSLRCPAKWRQAAISWTEIRTTWAVDGLVRAATITARLGHNYFFQPSIRKCPSVRINLSSCATAVARLRRLFFARLASDLPSRASAPGGRRLTLEQFEDRRLLAVAADDDYTVRAGGTLTVSAHGTW